MENKVQKLIYYISAMTPVAFVFSLVWYIQNKTLLIPILLIAVGMLFIFLFFVSFSYGKKHLPPINIRITDISPKDGWLIAYLVSYCLPLSTFIIKEANLFIVGAITIIIMMLLPFINSTSPNPLLFLIGYHFYGLGTENGVTGYILISRRTLRKKQDVKIIKRVFEFLLIDVKE